MRNPNGYGTVVKLSGNRRNPYAARKTQGWNDSGHPIYMTIGYYPTREEGMIALAEFNKAPYDVNAQKTTFEDLYDLWLDKKAYKLGVSSQSSLKSAYTHCKAIHQMKYKDIRAFHMQEVIDRCPRGYATQGAIKNLFGHLDRFSLELDITTRSYSDLVTSAPIPETSKQPFTPDEIARLWAVRSEPWIDTVLIFIYSGFRISELLSLRTENINLQDWTMQGGVKTKAGKDRIVPIHSKIMDIIKRRYDEGNEYLLSHNQKKVRLALYYSFWNAAMELINAEHTPHECRHTFRSLLDSAGANKKCIDLLMGHKSKDVGERIYTHKTLQELREAIELISH